jgi:hypothetical protein
MATEPSGILVPAYVIPTPGAWQPVLNVAPAMMLGGLIEGYSAGRVEVQGDYG